MSEEEREMTELEAFAKYIEDITVNHDPGRAMSMIQTACRNVLPAKEPTRKGITPPEPEPEPEPDGGEAGGGDEGSGAIA